MYILLLQLCVPQGHFYLLINLNFSEISRERFKICQSMHSTGKLQVSPDSVSALFAYPFNQKTELFYHPVHRVILI